MEDKANIWILILNYNSAKDTIELLTQIRNYHEDIPVLIIDNNSSEIDRLDLKSGISERSKKTILIENDKNLGYAAGNNIGMVRASEMGASYVWILNPDIRICRDSLEIMMSAFSENGKIAAVGPRICYRNDEDKIYSDGGHFNFRSAKTKHMHHNMRVEDVDTSIEEVSYVNGSSIVINLNTIKEIGYLNEDFFMYYEETEWCIRAKRAGWVSQINSAATVYHSSSNKGLIFNFYTRRNRLICAKIVSGKILIPMFDMTLRLSLQIFKYALTFKLPPREYWYRWKGLFNGICYNLRH